MCENWNLIVVRLSSENSKVLPFSSFAASARADDVFVAPLIKSRELNDAGRKETQEILTGFSIPFHPIEGLTHETHIICQTSSLSPLLCCVAYNIHTAEHHVVSYIELSKASASQPRTNERYVEGKREEKKEWAGFEATYYTEHSTSPLVCLFFPILYLCACALTVRKSIHYCWCCSFGPLQSPTCTNTKASFGQCEVENRRREGKKREHRSWSYFPRSIW